MNSISKIKLSDLPWKQLRKNAKIKNLTDKELTIDLIKLAPKASFDKHSHATTE
jgi:quercetin dioxygenase-like cupin family protein